MEEEKVTLCVDGVEKAYPKGTPYYEIAKEHQNGYQDDIVLVSVDNHLRELHKRVKKSGQITFVTTADRAGRKTYRRSVTLMMQKALSRLLGREQSMARVLYSVGQAYYCELVNYGAPDAELLSRLKEEMLRMAGQDIPIIKSTVGTDEAVELFRDYGMPEKECLFRYRRSSKVNLYSLDGYSDYFYGYMAMHTGYLKYFDLYLFQDGFLLMFPGEDTRKTAPFAPAVKYVETLRYSREWGRTMGIGTVGALNNAIASGRTKEIIQVQEALMDQRIAQAAAEIAASAKHKFVMVAGPSSSGKTTFASRLSVQLMAMGLRPRQLSLDNYYLNRDVCPKNADGEFDFECLESMDVEGFNRDMLALLNGETVDLPTFNFKTGRQEFHGNTLRLGEGDLLVVEGIHGLNERLTYSLPKESKFKIFISALTQINIDEHNYMPTTDARLIRRIVRDARTRDTTAQETIAMWPSVRRGEERHIFPYQDGADIMFNSAFIYELAVLKLYAEPLLFGVERTSFEYREAKRLLKFLDYFLPVPGDAIPGGSILREFIGGSVY